MYGKGALAVDQQFSWLPATDVILYEEHKDKKFQQAVLGLDGDCFKSALAEVEAVYESRLNNNSRSDDDALVGSSPKHWLPTERSSSPNDSVVEMKGSHGMTDKAELRDHKGRESRKRKHGKDSVSKRDLRNGDVVLEERDDKQKWMKFSLSNNRLGRDRKSKLDIKNGLPPGKRTGPDGSYFECMICDSGGNLLCCDSCPRVYHLECLTPPLKRAPPGKWLCPFCREQVSGSKVEGPPEIKRVVVTRSSEKLEKIANLRLTENKVANEKAEKVSPKVTELKTMRHMLRSERKNRQDVHIDKGHKRNRQESPTGPVKKLKVEQGSVVRSSPPSGVEKECSSEPVQDSKQITTESQGIDTSTKECTKEVADIFPPEEKKTCLLCGEVGRLACCDSCTKSFHLTCLDPPLKKIPKGQWNCSLCSSVEHKQNLEENNIIPANCETSVLGQVPMIVNHFTQVDRILGCRVSVNSLEKVERANIGKVVTKHHSQLDGNNEELPMHKAAEQSLQAKCSPVLPDRDSPGSPVRDAKSQMVEAPSISDGGNSTTINLTREKEMKNCGNAAADDKSADSFAQEDTECSKTLAQDVNALQEPVLTEKKTKESVSDDFDIKGQTAVIASAIVVPEDQGTMPEYEFLVKWVGRAHIHNEWVKESSLRSLAKRKLDNYKAKYGTLPLNLVDERWTQPQRVVARRKINGQVEFLVKWCGLAYDECTWEDASEPVLRESLDLLTAFEQREAEIAVTEIAEREDNGGSTLKQADLEALSAQPKELKGGLLFPHQMEAVNWLRRCWYKKKNVILADEMGLGKTISACAFLSSLHHEFKVKAPCLVLVPLSTMPNWLAEFSLWAPSLNVIEYHGSVKARAVIRQHEWYATSPNSGNKGDRTVKFHVMLTTYEMVIADPGPLRSVGWEVLIVDEGHRLKNSGSKLFTLLNTFSFAHRVLMTGTPLQNNLGEMYNLLNFLQPEKFPSLTAFQDKFSALSTAEQVEEIKKLVAPHMLRRLKKDTMQEIPPKAERVVPVELTSIQAEYYRALLTRNFQLLRQGTKSQQSMVNIIMQLRKVCNHPYLIPGTEPELGTADFLQEMRIKASAKLTLLHAMLGNLKEQGHRVLIFSQMTKLLDILEDYLTYEFGAQSFERVDGSVPAGARQASIARFNKDKSRFVFLLSTRACGLGINLATADTVVIYDSDFNPHADIQAMNRAHRIGQSKKLLVYRLVVRASVEERILQLAKKKLMLDHLFANKSGSQKEIEDILQWGAEELFQGTPEQANNESIVSPTDGTDEVETKFKKKVGGLGDVYNDKCHEAGRLKVTWDESAVKRLLDRSAVVADSAEGDAEGDMLGSFKAWDWNDQDQEPDEQEAEPSPSKESACTSADARPGDEEGNKWEKLLRMRWEKLQMEEEAALGRGKRQRKVVSYNECVAQKAKETLSESDEADEDPQPEYTPAGQALKQRLARLRMRQKERIANRGQDVRVTGATGPEHSGTSNLLSTSIGLKSPAMTLQCSNMSKERMCLPSMLDVPSSGAELLQGRQTFDFHSVSQNSYGSSVLALGAKRHAESLVIPELLDEAFIQKALASKSSKLTLEQNREESILSCIRGFSGNMPPSLPDGVNTNSGHTLRQLLPGLTQGLVRTPLSTMFHSQGLPVHYENPSRSFLHPPLEMQSQSAVSQQINQSEPARSELSPQRKDDKILPELNGSLNIPCLLDNFARPKKAKPSDDSSFIRIMSPPWASPPSPQPCSDSSMIDKTDLSQSTGCGPSSIPTVSHLATPFSQSTSSWIGAEHDKNGSLLDKGKSPTCTVEQWTEEELDALWTGVRRHGRGNWISMLQDPRLCFSQHRTAKELADRWKEEQVKILGVNVEPPDFKKEVGPTLGTESWRSLVPNMHERLALQNDLGRLSLPIKDFGHRTRSELMFLEKEHYYSDGSQLKKETLDISNLNFDRKQDGNKMHYQFDSSLKLPSKSLAGLLPSEKAEQMTGAKMAKDLVNLGSRMVPNFTDFNLSIGRGAGSDSLRGIHTPPPSMAGHDLFRSYGEEHHALKVSKRSFVSDMMEYPGASALARRLSQFPPLTEKSLSPFGPLPTFTSTGETPQGDQEKTVPHFNGGLIPSIPKGHLQSALSGRKSLNRSDVLGQNRASHKGSSSLPHWLKDAFNLMPPEPALSPHVAAVAQAVSMLHKNHKPLLPSWTNPWHPLVPPKELPRRKRKKRHRTHKPSGSRLADEVECPGLSASQFLPRLATKSGPFDFSQVELAHIKPFVAPDIQHLPSVYTTSLPILKGPESKLHEQLPILPSFDSGLKQKIIRNPPFTSDISSPPTIALSTSSARCRPSENSTSLDSLSQHRLNLNTSNQPFPFIPPTPVFSKLLNPGAGSKPEMDALEGMQSKTSIDIPKWLLSPSGQIASSNNTSTKDDAPKDAGNSSETHSDPDVENKANEADGSKDVSSEETISDDDIQRATRCKTPEM